MHIEELEGGEELVNAEGNEFSASAVITEDDHVVDSDAKRVLIGAGARVLFYPTLLYNVVRNKIQAEFRWWDWIDEFLLLGAVPFPSDVKLLKELGVTGVITMNEPYETLVPTSLYLAHGIDHLVLPTRDYLFAPSLCDICHAVEFVHKNSMVGRTTYIHCKAGRGRSTTIVICYLVQHKNMAPDDAYAFVKSRRPRVLLAPTQWQAVQEYYHSKVKCSSLMKTPRFFTASGLIAFDDGSVVVVTEDDLKGYDPKKDPTAVKSPNQTAMSLVCRFRVSFARLSFVSFCYEKITNEKAGGENGGSLKADQPGTLTVDIHLY